MPPSIKYLEWKALCQELTGTMSINPQDASVGLLLSSPESDSTEAGGNQMAWSTSHHSEYPRCKWTHVYTPEPQLSTFT